MSRPPLESLGVFGRKGENRERRKREREFNGNGKEEKRKVKGIMIEKEKGTEETRGTRKGKQKKGERKGMEGEG